VAVLLVSDYGADPAWWREALADPAGPIELRVWPEHGDPDEIDVVIIDTRMDDKGGFSRFRNLKWVSYLGHGVADILRDRSLPADVQVTRLRDGALAQAMTLQAVQFVLAHHTRAADFARLQAEAKWERLDRTPLDAYRVAVLGLGPIGAMAAEAFANLGYPVTGWSRSEKSIAGVTSRTGRAALDDIVAASDAIVALLPETPETIGLFDRDQLLRMKPGSLLANLGRGSMIVEDDLIAALDAGRPGHAALDVFGTEPLPADSSLWRHPAITVTPHAGGPYGGSTPVDEIAENLRRLRQGEPLLNLADPTKGY